MQQPSDQAVVPGHMPGLDGLRGLLVPIILTYHLGVRAYGGFLALEGFFVLSGFLITTLLLDRPPDLSGLGQWWLRRWRRLVPAVVVVVTVTVVAFRGTSGIAGDALATLTWWRNWQMAYGSTTYWSNVPSPLNHAWSLSVEEQFYVLFPLLLVGALWFAKTVKRSPARVVAAVCGFLAVVGYGWQAWLSWRSADLNRVYLGSDTRGGSILLGCAFGAFVSTSPSRFTPTGRWANGLALLGLATVAAVGTGLTIEDPFAYRGGFALAALGWVAVTVVASRPGLVSAALSWAPLRWMGVRSYGIYLWSWPVQVYLETHWPTAPRLSIAAATVLVAFALGELSYRLVEQPMRLSSSWAQDMRTRRFAWFGGISTAAAAILVVALTAPAPSLVETMTERSSATDAMASVGSLPVRTTLPPEPTTTAAAPATNPAVTSTSQPPVDPTTSTPTPSPTEPATPPPPPPPAPKPLVVLVGGDSQAATMANNVKRSELPDYIAVIANAGVLGCGVLVRTEGWMVDNPARGGLVDGSYCRGPGSADAAEVFGLAARPDWLVVTSGGYEQSHSYRTPDGRMLPPNDPEIRQAIKDALDVRIRRANAGGTRVALLEFACPGREVGSPGWDEFTPASIIWHNSILREVAAAHPGTITIPPSDQVCVGGDAAGAATPAKLAAWGTEDRVHVTDKGQAWVWRVQVGPALLAAA